MGQQRRGGGVGTGPRPPEGGFVIDPLALHQDALGLADEIPGADRFAELLRPLRFSERQRRQRGEQLQ